LNTEVAHTKAWVAAFAALMATTMAAATVVVNSVGLLASELIDEFGLSRAEVGGLATSFGVVAALTSIPFGHGADRFGGRPTMVAVLALSALSLVTFALAPSYVVLLVALAVGGLANAGAHPGTNHVISAQLPVGRRGLVTGIKMSGVQLAVFAAGLGLPIGIRVVGWRPTMLVIGAIPVLAIVALRMMLPPTRSRSTSAPGDGTAPGTMALTLYTFVMSAATAATVTYVPLFAEERLGLSVGSAGVALALIGGTAVVGRIIWGAVAERAARITVPLQLVGYASAAAVVGVFVSGHVGSGLLWPVAVALGATASSYNSVATMTLFRITPSDAVGRASGVVFTGFLAGLAAGPLAFGALVDANESYGPAWIATGVSFVVASFIVLVGLRRVADG
jgi:predicted MFS family arabinose efflux permease